MCIASLTQFSKQVQQWTEGENKLGKGIKIYSV